MNLLKKASAIPFKYVITEAPKKNNHKSNGKDKTDKNKDKTKEDEYREALRDLKISWLSKLELSHPLFKELRSEYEDHLPLYVTRLQALDSDKEREKCIPEILQLSKFLLSRIDQNSVLAYFGMKADNSSEASTVKSDKEEKRSQIVTALLKLGTAQADVLLNGWDIESCSVTEEDLNNTMLEVAKWVDVTDNKVLPLTIKHAVIRRQYGRALKLSLKQLDDKPNKDLEQKILELYSKLGWEHCVRHFSNWILVKYPQSYRPF